MRSLTLLVVVAVVLSALSQGGVGWGNGSGANEAYPYYGIHDLVAEIAFLKLEEFNASAARWIRDWFLCDGSRWGDWGHSYGQGRDCWLGYTDDPDSYYQDWSNHLFEVHGTRRGAPQRVQQLFDWAVANLTIWLQHEGEEQYREYEHRAVYAAGLLTHYFADMSQFGHTDYTKDDHSYPPEDSSRTYHAHYESVQITNELLEALNASLRTYQFSIKEVDDVASVTEQLARWVNAHEGQTVQYFDEAASEWKQVGSTYALLLTMFRKNFDAGVFYLGARGYNETVYALTLQHLRACVGNLTCILYTIYVQACKAREGRGLKQTLSIQTIMAKIQQASTYVWIGVIVVITLVAAGLVTRQRRTRFGRRRRR